MPFERHPGRMMLSASKHAAMPMRTASSSMRISIRHWAASRNINAACAWQRHMIRIPFTGFQCLGRRHIYPQVPEKCKELSEVLKLCPRTRICTGPYGLSSLVANMPATAGWVALKGDNDWISVSHAVTGWPACHLHTKIAGGIHGKPSWGTGNTAHSFRRNQACCVIPTAVPASAPTVPTAAPTSAPTEGPTLLIDPLTCASWVNGKTIAWCEVQVGGLEQKPGEVLEVNRTPPSGSDVF